MDIVIAVIVFLILAQFIDGRVAIVLGGATLAGRRWLRHRQVIAEQQRAVDSMKQLGLTPKEFESLSRAEAVERIASAQERLRQILSEKGMSTGSAIPVIGQEIPWTEVVRQVFRVSAFDRVSTTVGPGYKVKAVNHFMPLGYLHVESPILNQPAKLPITHRVDFPFSRKCLRRPGVDKVCRTGRVAGNVCSEAGTFWACNASASLRDRSARDAGPLL